MTLTRRPTLLSSSLKAVTPSSAHMERCALNATAHLWARRPTCSLRVTLDAERSSGLHPVTYRVTSSAPHAPRSPQHPQQVAQALGVALGPALKTRGTACVIKSSSKGNLQTLRRAVRLVRAVLTLSKRSLRAHLCWSRAQRAWAVSGLKPRTLGMCLVFDISGFTRVSQARGGPQGVASWREAPPPLTPEPAPARAPDRQPSRGLRSARKISAQTPSLTPSRGLLRVRGVAQRPAGLSSLVTLSVYSALSNVACLLDSISPPLSLVVLT